MALIKAKSIFFRENVRISSRNQNVQRVSIIVDAADRDSRGQPMGRRYEVDVDLGLEVLVHDREERTTIRVPWHMVRDWEELKSEDAKGTKTPPTKAA